MANPPFRITDAHITYIHEIVWLVSYALDLMVDFDFYGPSTVFLTTVWVERNYMLVTLDLR